jgi:transposase
MVFDNLAEKHGLKRGDNIQINVDYTTIYDDFLILVAYINIAKEKDIMLYFTMRNYPKRKNQMDQKKMELAFFKGLKQVLSKKYTYTIVADRGIGNLRIIQICENLDFNFVLRINEKLEMADGQILNLKEFNGENQTIEANSIAWNKKLTFEVKTKNDSTWYLATNLENQDVSRMYESRFKIEKLFQDLKSSGYNIESTKIRKYDRVKRLLYLACLSHSILVFLGAFVKYCKKTIQITGNLLQTV